MRCTSASFKVYWIKQACSGDGLVSLANAYHANSTNSLYRELIRTNMLTIGFRTQTHTRSTNQPPDFVCTATTIQKVRCDTIVCNNENVHCITLFIGEPYSPIQFQRIRNRGIFSGASSIVRCSDANLHCIIEHKTKVQILYSNTRYAARVSDGRTNITVHRPNR